MTADLRTLARTVEPIGDELFGVVWADGHESVFPLARLRDLCPCASCLQKRGAASPSSRTSGMALPVVGAPTPGAAATLARWEGVGRYAVRFSWADGHDTGIFTFEYLRAHCPCDACEAERAAMGGTAAGESGR